MGTMADIIEVLSEFNSYIAFDICATMGYEKYKFYQLQEAYDIYKHQLNKNDFLDLCTQLGRIYANLGHEQLAFDCYFEALEQAKDVDCNEKLAVLYSYMASTYLRLCQFKEALKYFHKERTCYYNLLNDSEDLLERVFLLHINLGMTYCALNNYEMAYNHLKIIEERRFFDITYKYRIVISYLRLKKSYGFMEKDKITYYTKQLLYEKNLAQYKEHFYEFYDIFNIQISLDDLDAAYEFLVVLQEIEKDLNYNNYRNLVLVSNILYYQKKNEKAKYLEALKYFFEDTSEQEDEIRELKQIRMLKRNEIYRIEQENKLRQKHIEILKQRSEEDELTKLPNRYYLKSYVEDKLAKAIKHSLPFAIDLIDVDFFKHYNDSFGHLKGDDCLVVIAGVLRSVAKIHTVIRYGGDEFIIIFYNQTINEIQKIVQEIQDSIFQCNIPQTVGVPSDRVSLSHGIFYTIPSLSTTFEALIKKADAALNQGKRQSRNAVCFDTSEVSHNVDFKNRRVLCESK